jgi:hypothetical protein
MVFTAFFFVHLCDSTSQSEYAFGVRQSVGYDHHSLDPDLYDSLGMNCQRYFENCLERQKVKESGGD